MENIAELMYEYKNKIKNQPKNNSEPKPEIKTNDNDK
jgi:hypothetical protein